jgi:hypothetical protein
VPGLFLPYIVVRSDRIVSGLEEWRVVWLVRVRSIRCASYELLRVKLWLWIGRESDCIGLVTTGMFGRIVSR